MDKEMTYMKFMSLLAKVVEEAKTHEQMQTNTEKLLHNIIDSDEIISLVLECLTIIAQSDIPMEILENPYGVIDIKKEDKKPDLKIVH